MAEALLYVPGRGPMAVSEDGLAEPADGRGVLTSRVSELLDCAPQLVDVLAIGTGYVVWSVFDSEEAVNPEAMAAVAELAGVGFNPSSDGEALRGPVLVVKI